MEDLWTNEKKIWGVEARSGEHQPVCRFIGSRTAAGARFLTGQLGCVICYFMRARRIVITNERTIAGHG